MEQSKSLTKTKKNVEFDFPKKPEINKQEISKQKKLTLICNLVSLDFSKQKPSFQFSVSFEPFIEDDNFSLKCLILRQLEADIRKNYDKFYTAGDTLFSIKGEEAQSEVSFKVNVNEINYKVTVKKAKNKIEPKKITTYTRENLRIKNFIENIIRNILGHNKTLVKFPKQDYFDFKTITNFGSLKHPIILKGFSTAILITELGLCLRASDKNKIICGKNALEKIEELDKNAGKDSPNENQQALLDYFKNRTVIAKYGAFRAYKIGDIAFEHNIRNTTVSIRQEDGSENVISLEEYYKTQYNIKIKNPNQPLFIELEQRRNFNNQKRTIRYFVPELMYITGVDELSIDDKEDIIKKAKLEPTEKVNAIKNSLSCLFENSKKKFIKKTKENVVFKSPNEIREEWGLTIENNFIEVEARELQLPSFEFGSKTESITLRNGRFSQGKVKTPISFKEDDYLLITWNHLRTNAKKDCEKLIKSCEHYGYSMEIPTAVFLESTDKNSVIEELRKFNYNHGKKIALVIVDDKTKHLYSTIKTFLYTKIGIPSQFMLCSPNSKKRNTSYFSAVANQMTVKCEGELFNIKTPSAFSKFPSMIVGIDSSKRQNGQTKYVLSSSYTAQFDKFYTDYQIGGNKEEPTVPLIALLSKALYFFKEVNKVYPSYLLIYRKGGNQSQTLKNAKLEVNEIKKLLEKKEYENLKFAFFIVNKNPGLKFFLQVNKNKYANAKTGTVIDSSVTEPEKFEFYLQGPDMSYGYTSPTHYLCLYNSLSSLSLLDFEEISYTQSFLFWTFSGPIRVPAALKNAEKCNFFSTKNLEDEKVGEDLKRTPYFV